MYRQELVRTLLRHTDDHVRTRIPGIFLQKLSHISLRLALDFGSGTPLGVSCSNRPQSHSRHLSEPSALVRQRCQSDLIKIFLTRFDINVFQLGLHDQYCPDDTPAVAKPKLRTSLANNFLRVSILSTPKRAVSVAKLIAPMP